MKKVLIGAVDRARVLEYRATRTTRLVNAIRAGQIKAPPPVLDALVKILPPEPEDAGSDEDEEDDVPRRRRRRTRVDANAESDLDVLARFLRNGIRDERLAAASCIAYAASILRRPSGPCDSFLLLYSNRETVAELKAGFDAAISEEIPEIQRDLLKAFPVIRLGGDELLPDFVKLLSAPQAEVQQAAVDAMRDLSSDRVSGAVKDIVVLLKTPVPSVRSSACVTLEWLGPDAVQAVPSLVDYVRDASELDRLVATRALVVIDPNGMELLKVSDRASRDALIESLRQIDEGGRDLRRLLPALWTEADRRAAETPVRRMKPIEIARILDCDSKTVGRLVKKKELHILGREGQKRSLVYLVTDEELVRVKAARLGNAH